MKIGPQYTCKELCKIADLILRVDGDRDHMNRSDLTCEQTQAIAYLLREIARNTTEGR